MRSVDQDEVTRRAREFQPLVEAEKRLARDWLLDDADGKRAIDDASVERLAALLATVRWGHDSQTVPAQPGMASIMRLARALTALSGVEQLAKAALDEIHP